jgi:hypothetical protein
MEQINNTIYRYKFDELFLEDLISFSKIHQFDDRKTFKEEWKLWCESNEEFINREENRLISLGYKGDCKDKMFKSARYYFRKKPAEKKEAKQRRNYIALSKPLIEMIDNAIKSHNIMKLKPSDGFDSFYKENSLIIEEEVNRLEGLLSKGEIYAKIKKTYKNRCFVNKDVSYKN